MNPIVEAKKPEIIALCRQYGVSKLDLFGSATGPNWDPETSDFDFVVEFEDGRTRILHRYLAFADDLEVILGHKVDVLFDRALKPRFRAFIEPQRATVYDSNHQRTAA